jgi:hypothetical protein
VPTELLEVEFGGKDARLQFRWLLGRPLLLSGGGGFLVAANWVHCTSAMYLCNHVRLAIGLEGTPDPSNTVVQAAVTASGYTGYVSEDFVAAAAPTKGRTGGGGSPGPSGSAGGTTKR